MFIITMPEHISRVLRQEIELHGHLLFCGVTILVSCKFSSSVVLALHITLMAKK